MPTLARELDRPEARLREQTPATADRLEVFRQDPSRLMADAGMEPDPWQRNLLLSAARHLLLLCSRQAGKSQTAAALALKQALLVPGSLVLLLSPTLRQSGELFRDKVLRLFTGLGRPVATTQESALQMSLANGSRIVSLPGEEQTIRGYSGVAMLVIDEASRVPDDLYRTVRPMLAVSKGQLIALSTPFGKRGWFFEEWERGQGWQRTRITARECPRISADFLAEEERALGPRWFRQEYMVTFEDAVDTLFRYEDIQAAFDTDAEPLFPDLS